MRSSAPDSDSAVPRRDPSQAFTRLDTPVERLAVPDVPIPFNTGLMEAAWLAVERIRAKVQLLLDY